MPVTVRPHESLEKLLATFLGTLTEVRHAQAAEQGLPRPVPVIVPAGQFSDWLQLRLAREQGVCMGLQFLRPQEFVGKVAALTPAGVPTRFDPWTRDALAWRLLPHIAGVAEQLGLPTDRELTVRESFATARTLADHFEHYGHSRAELLAAWRTGAPAPIGTKAASPFALEAEAWQRQLWLTLDAEILASPHARENPGLHLHWNGWESAQRAAELHPHLLVLGTGGLDPVLVRTLHLLAEAGADVRIDVVLPTLDYLGEFRDRGLRAPLEEDPEAEIPELGHPLITTLGRHAVGSFMLLGKLDENYAHWPEAGRHGPVQDEAPSTLLGNLQAAVRAHTSGLANSERFPAAGGASDEKGSCNTQVDGSLLVHSCHGPRRELEVLRDELLRAFAELPELRPEQILVLCSDLDTYAPLVDSVLAQGTPPLPVRLTERAASASNPLLDALASLLAYAQGRHSVSGLLGLLELRAVQKALAVEDEPAALESLKDWIRQSGLTLDLDAGERGTLELPEDESGTWRFAKDRLVAGMLFGPTHQATDAQGRHVLPLAGTLDTDTELRERLVGWLADLERHLRVWKTPATALDWAARLDQATLDVLRPDPREGEFTTLRPHLSFLQDVGSETPVDAGVLEDWFRGLLESEGGGRTKVTGSIAFGRFKQLAQLPCRVLALVGMQDGAYPRQTRTPSWDLFQLDPKPWDRNPRIEDRQMFLDALLTPRDRLIITASTQNLRTGKTEPFSSCVDDLLSHLDRSAGGKLRDKLVVKHRLQPFAPAYFLPSSTTTEEALPRSFNTPARDIARSLAMQELAPTQPPPFFIEPAASAVSPLPEELELSIEDLVQFWTNPARAWLRAQGITLARELPDDTELDRPPLVLDTLQAWQVANAAYQDALAEGTGLDLTKARLAGDRALPMGELGAQAWLTHHKPGLRLGTLVRSLRLPTRLACDVRVRVPQGSVRITGTVLQAGPAGEPALLLHRLGKYSKPKYALGAWITAVVASAAHEQARPSLLVDQETKDDAPLSLRAPLPQEEARRLLGVLVRGLLEGRSRPLCFAPIASQVYSKAHYGDAPAALLSGLKEAHPDLFEALIQLACAPDAAPPPELESSVMALRELLSEDAIGVAADTWEQESGSAGGEGHEDAARLTWRGQSPFACDRSLRWHAWSLAVSLPCDAWLATKLETTR